MLSKIHLFYILFQRFDIFFFFLFSRRFSSDEIQQLLNLLLLPTTDITLGLCFLFMVPSLVERNEQIIIEWLKPTMSSLETDDKLLMIGLFCITNYNEVKYIFVLILKIKPLSFFLLFSH